MSEIHNKTTLLFFSNRIPPRPEITEITSMRCYEKKSKKKSKTRRTSVGQGTLLLEYIISYGIKYLLLQYLGTHLSNKE